MSMTRHDGLKLGVPRLQPITARHQSLDVAAADGVGGLKCVDAGFIALSADFIDAV